jgi:hypothetical protein
VGRGLHFWSAQGHMSAPGVAMGVTEMRNYGSPRGCKSSGSGEGINFSSASPTISPLSGHGGRNQGVEGMRAGGGGEVMAEGG